MTDAIAHAILTFAMSTSAVQGTDKGNKAAYDPNSAGTAPSNSSLGVAVLDHLHPQRTLMIKAPTSVCSSQSPS